MMQDETAKKQSMGQNVATVPTQVSVLRTIYETTHIKGMALVYYSMNMIFLLGNETVKIDMKSENPDLVPCKHVLVYEGASQLSSPPLIRRQNHMIIVTMRARKHTNVFSRL